MIKKYILVLQLMLFAFVATKAGTVGNADGDPIKTPVEYFGYQPGADRMLLDYEASTGYMKELAASSSRVKMVEIGESAMGRKMYLVFISSPENIQNLDKLKNINKELATNPDLTDAEVKQYTKDGKVFIMSCLSMHSTEVGPAQAGPLVAYQLATTQDPDVVKQLNDVVYMILPSSNPDGMDMIAHHYMESKGTKYEGGSYPAVYNKYVGHDNNRDFVTLSQQDDKVIAHAYSTEWYPQVLVDQHQMGSTGARYFVPPNCDPIAENVDEKIWNWTWVFGSNIAKDLTAKGLKGVTQHSVFDNYWPGTTETGIWKNMISMLTEAASVQLAKPIYIEKSELTGGSTGLAEYKKGINFVAPWEGGWWHLSDIVDLEVGTAFSVIKTASYHKKDVLLNRSILCKESFEKGKTLAPAYFIFPAKQHDDSELMALLSTLNEHGVYVYKTNKEVVNDGKIIEKGSYVVPLSQPYRPFVKDVLDKQKYPERHYTPGGKLMKPYDITNWSLPLNQGIESYKINKVVADIENNITKVSFPMEFSYAPSANCKTLVFPVTNNESFKVAFAAMKNGISVSRATEDFSAEGKEVAKGDFLISTGNSKMKDIYGILTVKPKELTANVSEHIAKLEQPKIALVQTVFSDMDAGWTRFVFDSYNLPFTVLKPQDLKTTDLSKFSVIVFPNSNKSLLMDAKYKRGKDVSIPNYDEKYLKGMGRDGLEKVLKFENNGGTVVSWGSSTEVFMGIHTIKTSKDKTEEFELPVKNIAPELAKEGFYVPGSLFNIDLKEDHPLTLGMGKHAHVFINYSSPIFGTSIPFFDTDRRVIASYPDEEEDIVASGYAENEKVLEGKSAMVWSQKGKGNFVFYGFNPEFRGSTTGVYKLLFNALLLK